jgi:hypothetical protein
LGELDTNTEISSQGLANQTEVEPGLVEPISGSSLTPRRDIDSVTQAERTQALTLTLNQPS